MIRILVADDHEMVREGFRRILEAHSDLRIVAEASDGGEVLALLEREPVDVLVLDISMPGTGFPELMSSIGERFPRVRVLVVSMHPAEAWVVQAFRLGARGYISKSHSAEELVEGVRRLHAGGRYVTPAVAEALAGRLGGEEAEQPHDALSARELQVLRKLGEGKMLKTVAREMGLSPKTVSTYRARVLGKLGLGSTAELIRYALEHGLVD